MTILVGRGKEFRDRAYELAKLHWFLQTFDIVKLSRDDVLIVTGDEHEWDAVALESFRELERGTRPQIDIQQYSIRALTRQLVSRLLLCRTGPGDL